MRRGHVRNLQRLGVPRHVIETQCRYVPGRCARQPANSIDYLEISMSSSADDRTPSLAPVLAWE
ncbi:hypothetical protein ACWD4J_43550 [Streptomyces sp. NPDC002577]